MVRSSANERSSYFTLAMILLLIFDDNDESPESLEDRILLEYALERLSCWKVVPFIRKSLRELERIAQMKGLTVPP